MPHDIVEELLDDSLDRIDKCDVEDCKAHVHVVQAVSTLAKFTANLDYKLNDFQKTYSERHKWSLKEIIVVLSVIFTCLIAGFKNAHYIQHQIDLELEKRHYKLEQKAFPKGREEQRYYKHDYRYFDNKSGEARFKKGDLEDERFD